MFESLSHLALQHYWWIIVSILGSVLVFLMFVQGGQTLLGNLGKNETEKTILVNALGRKWEFTFTTLVTFGGAFFASFPLFYATSFGGAYWVWILILFAFVIQAVSYEFRTKAGNFLGQRTYETFLYLNGLLGTILVGTAVGTFFTGSQFSINELRQVTWEGPARGLEAALNLQNLALGLSVFFLSRTLAALYFMNHVDEETIFTRSKKHVLLNAVPFLAFFLFFLVRLLLIQGYAYDPQTHAVTLEDYKYLHNFLHMPLVLALLLLGVVGVLYGIGTSVLKPKYTKGIWFAGAGTILTVFSLFLVAGFNHTAFYPSSFDLQSSLTIENASSSKFTLTTMSYVSLLVPFVIAYMWYAWYAMNRKKINREEIDAEDHVY
jgi:cytochrome d ubiquinol oxidase subunit II